MLLSGVTRIDTFRDPVSPSELARPSLVVEQLEAGAAGLDFLAAHLLGARAAVEERGYEYTAAYSLADLGLE